MKSHLAAAFLLCSAASVPAALANTGEPLKPYEISYMLTMGIHEKDYVKIQEALLYGADINKEEGGRYGGVYSPLISATDKRDPELVAFLIQSGAIPTSSALRNAIKNSAFFPEDENAQIIAEYLIEESTFLSGQQVLNETLLYSSYECNAEFMEKLMEAGADPNYAMYNNSYTPIISTVRIGANESFSERKKERCLETAAAMFRHGADPDMLIQHGNLNEAQHSYMNKALERAGLTPRAYIPPQAPKP